MVDKTVGKYLEKLQESGAFILGYMASIRLLVIIITRLIIAFKEKQLDSNLSKSLKEIIQEIYEITGSFAFERSDLRLEEALKQRIVENCTNNKYQTFGNYKVRNIDTLDGFKYYFNDDEWLIIRPSGTEPVLRTYAESHTKEEALAILKACYDTIMKA